jgi:phosphate:Na+ symporter
MQDPNFTVMSIKLVGGLALFLYGMGLMTDGLKLVAGSSLRGLLNWLTRNRFSGVLTGAGITAAIQSSSITTVLVVGFISAGLMSLSQSVPVIIGANVGTTVTAQIIAFKITKAALVMIAVGFAIEFALKKPRAKKLGSVLLGLGFIFFGMEIMSDATAPLRDYQPFLDLMQTMSNPLLAILLAAIFTALVQSSSATTGIVIVLAGQGLIPLEAGIAMIMGANIGTCVTSLLAAIGKPREAMQAAGVHVMFNVAGVLLWVGLIGSLAGFVRWLSPESSAALPMERLAAETPRQIANAHTVFNVANMLIFIWLTVPMAWLVKKIVPDKPVSLSERAAPQFLDAMFLSTPDLALQRVRLELVHLGTLVLPLIREGVPTAISGSREDIHALAARDDDVDSLYAETYAYIGALSQYEMSTEQTHLLAELTEILNVLEALGDLVEINIAPLGLHRAERLIQLNPRVRQQLQPLVDLASDSLADAIKALETGDQDLAIEVSDRKVRFSAMADEVFALAAYPQPGDGNGRLAAIRIEIALLELLRRTFYFAKRIAKAVVEIESHPDTVLAADQQEAPDPTVRI